MTDLIFVTADSNGAVAHAAEAAPGAPQPMVSLDPGGQATPLSYSVPEPMSYSGRNYITLQLAADAFATPAIDPEQVLALTPPPVNGIVALAAASLPASLTESLTALPVSHGARMPAIVSSLAPGGRPPPPEPPDPPSISVTIDTPASGCQVSRDPALAGALARKGCISGDRGLLFFGEQLRRVRRPPSIGPVRGCFWRWRHHV